MLEKCKPVFIFIAQRLTKSYLNTKELGDIKIIFVPYYGKKWRNKFPVENLYIVFLIEDTEKRGRNHTCRKLLFTRVPNVPCENLLKSIWT